VAVDAVALLICDTLSPAAALSVCARASRPDNHGEGRVQRFAGLTAELRRQDAEANKAGLLEFFAAQPDLYDLAAQPEAPQTFSLRRALAAKKYTVKFAECVID